MRLFSDDLNLKEWLREIRIEKIELSKTKYKRISMKNKLVTALITISSLTPMYAHAGVETMMSNIQNAILNILAPMICICGIIFNGFKLAMGEESAKKALLWSCFGTIAAFSAPGILSFLQNRVASA